MEIAWPFEHTHTGLIRAFPSFTLTNPLRTSGKPSQIRGCNRTHIVKFPDVSVSLDNAQERHREIYDQRRDKDSYFSTNQAITGGWSDDCLTRSRSPRNRMVSTTLSKFSWLQRTNSIRGCQDSKRLLPQTESYGLPILRAAPR